MASNLGAINYGSMTLLPGYDVAASGAGDLIVSGTTLLAGAATNIQGTLTTVGATTLQSTLSVAGASVFNALSTFNELSSFTAGLVTTSLADAIDPASGAMQVRGGLGVGLSTYLGALLDVGGATALHDTLTVDGSSSFTGQMTITNATESTSAQTGGLVVTGGIGTGGNIQSGTGNLYLGGNLTLNSEPSTGRTYLTSLRDDLFINNAGTHDVRLNANSTANFRVANSINVNPTGLQVLVTADSTAANDGALQVAGGAGIALTLNVGGDINAPIDKTLTVGSIVATNTTDATALTTGSFQVSGGGSVVGNFFVGGHLDIASTAGVASNVGNFRLLSSSSGANWFQSGDVGRTTNNWTPLKFSPVNSTTSILTMEETRVTIDTGTASTSTTTGALVVTGGSGISGDLYVGATSTFTGVANFLADQWTNSKALYLGNHSDTTSGLILNATVAGPLLFGATGGALGTTSGTAKNALTWNSDQNVVVLGTLETSSPTTGALTVRGGIATPKSVSIGTSLYLQGGSWTSTGDDIYINANNSSTFIRTVVDSASGEVESSLSAFHVRTQDVNGVTPYATFTVDKVTGHVLCTNVDEATADSTGSFQVSGGASISKSIWVGANSTIVGNLSVNGTISTTGANPVLFTNTTDSTSVGSGSLIVSGGTSIGLNLNVGGIGVFTNTATSTSPQTGSLQTLGGLGVAENVNVGGSVGIAGPLSVVGNIVASAGTVRIANTTTSTSPTTGALVAAGGVGIGDRLTVGSVVTFLSPELSTSPTTGGLIVTGGVGFQSDFHLAGIQRIADTTQSTSLVTGSFVTAGGGAFGANLNVGGDIAIDGTLTVAGNISSTGGTVHFTNTLDSAAPDGGSVVIDGGVGIAKSLFVGSTRNSTSPGSGSAVFFGGIGVAADGFFGGNITLAGTNPIVTFASSGLNAPTLNAHSVGTKVLYKAVGGVAAADYATGMEAGALWTSVPTSSGAESFNWYGGVDIAMALTGSGLLRLNGTAEATSPTAGGTLQVQGGAGIAASLYVGNALSVSGTSMFTGSMTTSSNVTSAGILRITNTTNSTTPTTGSIRTSGGIGVALDAQIGQDLTVTRNSRFVGNVAVAGTTVFENVLDSTTAADGAVVIRGGLGVGANVNVGGIMVIAGSTTINGDLFVRGTRTEVNTTVLSTRDNVILVNSGPSGSASSGLASKRYQFANDNGEGDVVNGDAAEHTGTAQGGTATTITLATSANATDDWYNGAWIVIGGQVRRINTYVGASRTATIYTTADQATLDPVPSPAEGMDFTTPPAAGVPYSIFSSQYVVTVYDEVEGEYTMGTTAVNPVGDAVVTVRNRLKIHAGELKLSEKLHVDTIDNYTAGAGTTIEGVLMKDTEITGVTLINGSKPDVTAVVELVDDDNTAVAPLPGTQTSGAYMVLVADVNNTGTAATFLVSGSTSRGGSVMRATNTTGANGEHLTIVWRQNEVPSLRFIDLPANATGALYRYAVKILAV